MKLSVAVTLAVSLFAAPSFAQDKPQDKPSLSAFLAQGFLVIHSEIGSPFLQFILKKDNQLVWCSVELRSGETQSCRVLK
ncbi:MAG TPA: hypothetical protein VHK44_04065 [Xanthobacteraceae bacterium]|nr:hypothetical protein [Xanthobacteraceae bacterium]